MTTAAAAATTTPTVSHGITTHVTTAMTANTSTFKIQQHDRINNDGMFINLFSIY